MADSDSGVSPRESAADVFVPKAESKRPAAAVGTAVAAVVAGSALVALGAAGLAVWSGAGWFVDKPPYDSKWVGFTAGQFWWLFAFTLCTPSGIAVFITGSSALVRMHGPETAVFAIVQAVFGFLCFVAGCLGVALWGGQSFMNCVAVFCAGHISAGEDHDDKTQPEAGMGWQGIVGTAAFLSLAPLGLLLILAAQKHATARPSTAHMIEKASNPAFRPAQVRDLADLAVARRRRIARNVVLVALLLAFCAFCSFYLPNSWEYFTATRIAYFAAMRVPSLGDGNATMVAKCVAQPKLYTCPEYPWALMRTGQVEITSRLVLKLFPGNVLLYVYLLAVLIVGACLVHLSPGTSRKLGRPFAPSWFSRLPGPMACRPSLGNALVAGATFFLVVLWTLYWLHDHSFNGAWAPKNAAFPQGMPQTERIARTAGQLAVLFLSLLMFGTARHGTLHKLLGTAFERTINAHKLLGYLMLGAVLIHAILWAQRYREWGRSGWAIFAVIPQGKESIDNFTVPLSAYASILLFLAMGVFALEPVRRRFFELFYYTHLFAAWTTLPATLWHAAAGWEYMLPGLSLWFFDRLLRMHRGNAHCTLIKASVIRGDVARAEDAAGPPRSGGLSMDTKVTELKFVVDAGALQAARPGQYVFVNVPELSIFEWHPFTISHCPGVEPGRDNGGNYLSLHIKSMGSGTWTDRLFDLVMTHVQPDGTMPEGAMTLAVDGPCGAPFDWSGHTDVVLIGGGIGVTPVACIYDAVKREREAFGTLGETAALTSGPRKLRAVWMLPEPSLIATALGDSLRPSVSDEHEDVDDAVTKLCFPSARTRVYVTRAASGQEMDGGRLRDAIRGAREGDERDARYGEQASFLDFTRPDVRSILDDELGDAVNSGGRDGEGFGGKRRPLVFACGPPALVSTIVAWCDAHGVAVQTETFLL